MHMLTSNSTKRPKRPLVVGGQWTVAGGQIKKVAGAAVRGQFVVTSRLGFDLLFSGH